MLFQVLMFYYYLIIRKLDFLILDFRPEIDLNKEIRVRTVN
jgi:hypothetical protein